MMGIFLRKEKIKASDLGKALLVFVDVFDRQNYESIRSTIEEIQKESSLNSSQILFEYCCLKIFTIDFAAFQVLGNTDKKSKILDSFYEGTEEWCNENPSRFPHMYDEIKLRLLDYTISLKDETEVVKDLGPGWPVGKVFAKYCRVEKNPAKTKIAMIGATVFSQYLLTVMKSIDSFQIV
jgi:hypothetical protein